MVKISLRGEESGVVGDSTYFHCVDCSRLDFGRRQRQAPVSGFAPLDADSSSDGTCTGSSDFSSLALP